MKEKDSKPGVLALKMETICDSEGWSLGDKDGSCMAFCLRLGAKVTAHHSFYDFYICKLIEP